MDHCILRHLNHGQAAYRPPLLPVVFSCVARLSAHRASGAYSDRLLCQRHARPSGRHADLGPMKPGQISPDADTSDSAARNAVRYLPGGAPCHRAKDRLNAYSEVYPTSRVIRATGSAVSRSLFAASSIRHLVRYSAGGHPTSHRTASAPTDCGRPGSSRACLHGHAVSLRLLALRSRVDCAPCRRFRSKTAG